MAAAADILLANLRAAKVTPKALSEALDVTDAMASMMLSGKRGIPAWHLDKIAELMDTTVPRLFEPRDAHPLSRKRLSDTKKPDDVTSPVPGIGDKIGIPTASQPLSSNPTAPSGTLRGQGSGPSSSVSSSRAHELAVEQGIRLLELEQQLREAIESVSHVADILGGRGATGTAGADKADRRKGGDRVHRPNVRRSGGGRR